MLNGLQVMGSFDQALLQAQRDAALVDGEVQSLTDRLIKLRDAEATAYGKLARLRVHALSSNTMIDDLSAADQRARALLAQRSQSLKALEARLAEVEQKIAAATAERNDFMAEAEKRQQALQQAEDAVRKQLAEDETYRQQHARTQEAEQITRRAEQKAAVAEKDRLDKGKSYEADPLFYYLWQRGYGTSGYHAGALTRFFDRHVARLVQYDKARANYSMLLEIPRRIGEHATRQRTIADEEQARLVEMERQALQTGELSDEREAMQAAQQRLDAAEDAVEAIEDQRRKILDERAILTRGDDEMTRQAIEIIEAALRRSELRTLREQARRTPLPDDDAVVVQIEGIEGEIARVLSGLKTYKERQSLQRQRMSDLEETRREYRRRGYGRDAWDFGDNGFLSVLLMELLRGGLSGDAFRDQMQRHRVPQMPDPFGMGGGMPTPRFPQFPDFGGSGGLGGGFEDGFRTGGSF